MKKTIVAGVAGAAIAGGALGFAAPAFADTPTCSYNQPSQASNVVIAAQGICGLPDLSQSMLNAGANLANNFSPSKAAQNVSDNFNAGDAAANLQHNLTHGVGTEDKNAP
jgi:hypothetical protein